MWAWWAAPNEALTCLAGRPSNCGKVNLFVLQTAAKVLRNMLSAHAQAYKAIKAMPHADGVHVGLVHNVFWTEPKRHNPLYGHVRWGTGLHCCLASTALSLRMVAQSSSNVAPQSWRVASAQQCQACRLHTAYHGRDSLPPALQFSYRLCQPNVRLRDAPPDAQLVYAPCESVPDTALLPCRLVIAFANSMWGIDTVITPVPKPSPLAALLPVLPLPHAQVELAK